MTWEPTKNDSFLTEDGENCIVVTLGANLEIQPSRVDEIEDILSKAHIILIQSEIPQETNLRAFEVARKHGGNFHPIK